MGGQAAGAVPAPRRQPGGPAKGDRRRQAIVEAIEKLLDERTIAQLSVEDIAAEAGISRSGFYFYFESKYAALGDALTDIAQDMVTASEDFFGGSAQAPEDYIRDALESVARLWSDHESLLRAIVDASHSDVGARAIWDEWRERFIEQIAARIGSEQSQGRAPRGPVTPRDHARALLAMNLGLFYEDGVRGASEEEFQRSIDTLTRMWLSSVWGVMPAA